MGISLKGFNDNAATFYYDGAADVGDVVKISANDTVTGCSSNNVFIGVLRKIENEFSTVQISGYARVRCSGTSPSHGLATLAADGSGAVKIVSTGGREYMVMDVDTKDGTIGILLY
jgi:hypothetical protein